MRQPDLEPGLKVQTERRLESLQADLARAERRDTEKKIGAKYHMVKFFGACFDSIACPRCQSVPADGAQSGKSFSASSSGS